MRDPLTRCFWVGVVVLSVGWALLVPFAARAQPSGVPSGAVFVPVGEPFVVPADAVATSYVASVNLLCSEPIAWLRWTTYEAGQTLYGFDPGCWDADFVELTYPHPGAGGSWVQVRYVSGDPPQPSGFSWSDPADVLQLLLWGAVPLVGFWGYSMGARE